MANCATGNDLRRLNHNITHNLCQIIAVTMIKFDDDDDDDNMIFSRIKRIRTNQWIDLLTSVAYEIENEIWILNHW